jgi:hypothetical protein
MNHFQRSIDQLDRRRDALAQYSRALGAFAGKLDGRDDEFAEHARAALGAELQSVAADLEREQAARGAVEKSRTAAEQANQAVTEAHAESEAAKTAKDLIAAQASEEMAKRAAKSARDAFELACARCAAKSVEHFALAQGLGQYRAAALQSDLARFATIVEPRDGRYGSEESIAREWLKGTLRELSSAEPSVLVFLACDLVPKSDLHSHLYQRLAAKYATAA